jgi:ABC-type Na+ transport system ATPase subunit NatA
VTPSTPPKARAPLLDFEAARVARRDGSIGEALSLRVEGPGAALAGDFADFFSLLSGQARLVSGRAEILGVPAVDAVRTNRVGLALLDPPLPPQWTAERYLDETALLAGLDRADTARQVAWIVRRFELESKRHTKLGELSLLERRALLILGATLGNPKVLCLEAPLARLDERAQAYVEDLLFVAGEGRMLIVSVSELPAAGGERSLAETLGVVVREGGVVHDPGSGACVVALLSGAAEFTQRLDERGLTHRSLGVDPLLVGMAGVSRELCRLEVELALGMQPSDLYRVACEAGAVVIELAPR